VQRLARAEQRRQQSRGQQPPKQRLADMHDRLSAPSNGRQRRAPTPERLIPEVFGVQDSELGIRHVPAP
jgi:hypothetical protein